MKSIYERKVNIYILALMLIMMCIGITGCTSSDKEEASDNVVSKAGTVQLYHATETEVVPDDERYQLVQPDNLSAALEEVIENMTISSELTIDRYVIDENRNITLTINVRDTISEEALLLNQAAIVRSIKGLDAGSVAITLQDESGNIIESGTYTDASFYYYED